MEPRNHDDEDLERALEAALREDGGIDVDDATIAAYVAGSIDAAGREGMLRALAESRMLRERVLSVTESFDQLRGVETSGITAPTPSPFPVWRRRHVMVGAIAAALAGIAFIGIPAYRTRIAFRDVAAENQALRDARGDDALRFDALEQARKNQDIEITELRNRETWPGGWVDPVVVTADKPVFRSTPPNAHATGDATRAAPFVLLSFDLSLPDSIPDTESLRVVVTAERGGTILMYESDAGSVRTRRRQGLGLETVLVPRAKLPSGSYVLRAYRASTSAPVWQLAFAVTGS